MRGIAPRASFFRPSLCEDPAMLEAVDLERRPRELALMYSRRCNIACRHCCIESSPHVRGEMGMAAATRFIAESAAIPQFMKMTFTGGEPFIYQNEHLE